jgi:hypothetical protein
MAGKVLGGARGAAEHVKQQLLRRKANYSNLYSLLLINGLRLKNRPFGGPTNLHRGVSATVGRRDSGALKGCTSNQSLVKPAGSSTVGRHQSVNDGEVVRVWDRRQLGGVVHGLRSSV